ncbi:MAG: ATP-binding cassette domain-containing protein [Planctomycetota bacterium]|jgi:ABC-type multidrug transport system ATPase subunit
MNKDSNTPVFQARGLCKRFGKNQVLNDLNLELVPGEVTVLLGKNGAGKSTAAWTRSGDRSPCDVWWVTSPTSPTAMTG